MGRLYETSGGAAGITRFVYDGDRLIAEYNSNGTLLRRYVHGPGVDEPIVWYEGASVSTNRRFLHSNHQGSIIAYTNNSGVTQETETYDPFGVPGASYTTRFQYTGQTMIPELGLYNYKARFYNQNIGRFMQVDPIGYDDQINLYAYVGNDPWNNVDPDGRLAIPMGLGGCAITGPACPVGGAIGGLIGKGLTILGIAAIMNSDSESETPETTSSDNDKGESNTNPYAGPVDEPVIAVDGDGNAIPVEEGEQITSSPDGKYQQVRGKDGQPTGTRKDKGGHKGHSDPKAREPHGHRPSVTDDKGNPHLPLKEPKQ